MLLKSITQFLLSIHNAFLIYSFLFHFTFSLYFRPFLFHSFLFTFVISQLHACRSTFSFLCLISPFDFPFAISTFLFLFFSGFVELISCLITKVKQIYTLSKRKWVMSKEYQSLEAKTLLTSRQNDFLSEFWSTRCFNHCGLLIQTNFLAFTEFRSYTLQTSWIDWLIAWF